MRLGLATTGTREALLIRFKRWIMHRAVVAVAGARHLPNVEKPAVFNRLLLEWLVRG